MKTSRPIRARIAPDAILKNYRLAKRHAPAAKAWAVIKANAARNIALHQHKWHQQ